MTPSQCKIMVSSRTPTSSSWPLAMTRIPPCLARARPHERSCPHLPHSTDCPSQRGCQGSAVQPDTTPTTTTGPDTKQYQDTSSPGHRTHRTATGRRLAVRSSTHVRTLGGVCPNQSPAWAWQHVVRPSRDPGEAGPLAPKPLVVREEKPKAQSPSGGWTSLTHPPLDQGCP